LLRMLEARTVSPLGGQAEAQYDVRVIAATHHDLRRDVARGAFRGDVYYRLAVIEVRLPALRERIEDIPDLVARLLEGEGIHEGDLNSKNLDRLMAFSWPGNVRGLRNVIARAIALRPPGAPFAKMPVLLAGSRTDEGDPAVDLQVPFSDAKARLI